MSTIPLSVVNMLLIMSGMSSVKAQPIPEIMVAIMMPLRRVRLMRGQLAAP